MFIPCLKKIAGTMSPLSNVRFMTSRRHEKNMKMANIDSTSKINDYSTSTIVWHGTDVIFPSPCRVKVKVKVVFISLAVYEFYK